MCRMCAICYYSHCDYCDNVYCDECDLIIGSELYEEVNKNIDSYIEKFDKIYDKHKINCSSDSDGIFHYQVCESCR
jgi:hypothetical protein